MTMMVKNSFMNSSKCKLVILLIKHRLNKYNNFQPTDKEYPFSSFKTHKFSSKLIIIISFTYKLQIAAIDSWLEVVTVQLLISFPTIQALPPLLPQIIVKDKIFKPFHLIVSLFKSDINQTRIKLKMKVQWLE